MKATQGEILQRTVRILSQAENITQTRQKIEINSPDTKT